jgi:hypothetical protein
MWKDRFDKGLIAVENITTPMSLTGSSMGKLLTNCSSKEIGSVMKYSALLVYQDAMMVLEDYVISLMEIEKKKKIEDLDKNLLQALSGDDDDGEF